MPLDWLVIYLLLLRTVTSSKICNFFSGCLSDILSSNAPYTLKVVCTSKVTELAEKRTHFWLSNSSKRQPLPLIEQQRQRRLWGGVSKGSSVGDLSFDDLNAILARQWWGHDTAARSEKRNTRKWRSKQRGTDSISRRNRARGNITSLSILS